MAKSLFITYDGLTDPLGQSQILPYLSGLSREGHQIHILSCEKKERFLKHKELIEKICEESGIQWTPLPFHTSPPVLSKYYDLYQMMRTASRLHKQHHFDIIHCRSYLSADIGRRLKKKTGVKYLFDMRGFWVDERIDGGLWNMDHLFYRVAYKRWKRKEALLIHDADHIISLTEAGKKEVQNWSSYTGAPITVIPCSADMDLFTLSNEDEKKKARKQLNIKDNAFVLSYLGSLGTWYLLDEMLLLFQMLKEVRGDAKFLLLTPDDPQKVYSRAENYGLTTNDFIICFAQRKEVPMLMKASDISVSFIKPAYSKIASSPTKLGELLAMGIPVICNDIGDVGKIVLHTNGGAIVNGFDRAALQPIIDFICLKASTTIINRKNVVDYYSLTAAVCNYKQVYKSLLSNK